jgi:hypothetical protein
VLPGCNIVAADHQRLFGRCELFIIALLTCLPRTASIVGW